MDKLIYVAVISFGLFFVVGKCFAHDADPLLEPATLLNNPCARYIGITKSPFCKLEARITALEGLLRDAYKANCKPRGSFKCLYAVPDSLRLERGY